MPQWITLLTFRQAAQAHLIKTKLESEGIDVFIKNEHIAQLAPHHSEPAGPVKLQVQEDDLEMAASLLKQIGYLKEKQQVFRKSALIKGIDRVSLQIPGLRNQPLQLRLIIAAALFLVILTVVVSLLTLPRSL